jgi:hypothetical protein
MPDEAMWSWFDGCWSSLPPPRCCWWAAVVTVVDGLSLALVGKRELSRLLVFRTEACRLCPGGALSLKDMGEDF